MAYSAINDLIEEFSGWGGNKSYMEEGDLMIGYETGKVFVESSKNNYGEAQAKAANASKMWLRSAINDNTNNEEQATRPPTPQPRDKSITKPTSIKSASSMQSPTEGTDKNESSNMVTDPEEIANMEQKSQEISNLVSNDETKEDDEKDQNKSQQKMSLIEGAGPAASGDIAGDHDYIDPQCDLTSNNADFDIGNEFVVSGGFTMKGGSLRVGNNADINGTVNIHEAVIDIGNDVHFDDSLYVTESAWKVGGNANFGGLSRIKESKFEIQGDMNVTGSANISQSTVEVDGDVSNTGELRGLSHITQRQN